MKLEDLHAVDRCPFCGQKRRTNKNHHCECGAYLQTQNENDIWVLTPAKEATEERAQAFLAAYEALCRAHGLGFAPAGDDQGVELEFTTDVDGAIGAAREADRYWLFSAAK